MKSETHKDDFRIMSLSDGKPWWCTRCKSVEWTAMALNGPYFNNDKSPWFDATTDMAGLKISPRDIAVRGLSCAFYLIRSCLLWFALQDVSKPIGSLNREGIPFRGALENTFPSIWRIKPSLPSNCPV